MTWFLKAQIVIGILTVTGCASSSSSSTATAATSAAMPKTDPRVGLKAGVTDAGVAAWNLKLVSNTPPSEKFVGVTNSDLSFLGPYAIQGSYDGFQVWDIANPAKPALKTAYLCPASQSDVSVWKNLLFVSGEGMGSRLDCGAQGVQDSVSHDRLRGIRIFDVSDITQPKYLANVQTCRGSHTHTVVSDPNDSENIYVYISGSAPVRSPSELPGCSSESPDSNPNSSLFRIEVIKVPLAHPEQAAVVSAPRIFEDLVAPPRHGEAPADVAANAKAVAEAKAKGGFTATINGSEMVVPSGFINPMLDSVVKARQGTGAPTAADSAALREALPGIVAKYVGPPPSPGLAKRGPTQCHDITVYPALGLAGGACGGYGLLLDIKNAANPSRIGAVSDSNFSFWHSATFNNDGTKILFSDEWGGGGQPRCRATDKPEWGADAIFALEGNQMTFKSYYKLPAAQTQFENCVAHNGSLIPVPGRDIMVQAWYQGGLSMFDFTDSAHPVEIAYFDRGPLDAKNLILGGYWSAYWYNGAIYGSEIARGVDIFKLRPSEHLTQNEIDAAAQIRSSEFNPQEQMKISWPANTIVAKAYLDQLVRSRAIPADRAKTVTAALEKVDGLRTGKERGAGATLDQADAIAGQFETEAKSAAGRDAVRMHALATTIKARTAKLR